jgi:hypothetical protein
MSHGWEITALTSEKDALDVFADLSGRRWLSRGQSRPYGSLLPSIDRKELSGLSRVEKLRLERQSIEIFRSTARFYSGAGEQAALSDDIIALMVLRHYGVPTRLLDWSMSPYIAAYFSACDDDTENGEIWSFDEPLYEQKGKEQWLQLPETTSDGSGDPNKFDAKLTAFSIEEPADWFCCGFYPMGFPRQNAQAGAYSITPSFTRDHAAAIMKLFGNCTHCRLYIVSKTLKPALRNVLRETYGIWRGSLFPDSAGAADTAGKVFPHGKETENAR